jgi:membrane fusion protein, heavy metal efflux system
MKPTFLPFHLTVALLLMLLLSSSAHIKVWAHGDDEHAQIKGNGAELLGNYTAQTASDRYEYVLKYPHTEVGENVTYTLYIANVETNTPIKASALKLVFGAANVKPTPLEPGIYRFEAKSTPGETNLTITISAPPGPDLVLLKSIHPATEPVPNPTIEEEKEGIPSWLLYALFALGGAFVTYLLTRLGKKAKLAILLIGMAIPARAPAHGPDEEHESGKETGTNAQHNHPPVADGQFYIGIESQFLFGMLTERLAATGFSPSEKVFGTIMPTPQGQAQVSSPQVGVVAKLPIRVGQKVSRGQLLATIEQSIDAQTMANLTAERNNAKAELTAAEADLARLKTVADLVSARDITEATARVNRAKANKAVYQKSSTGVGRGIDLRSPISGIIQNFSIAKGSTVQAGLPLITVTDLSRVYVEAQVFDQMLPLFSAATNFTVTCADPDRAHATDQVKLISLGQVLNPTNQSQRVLFEVVNGDDAFKIGEFVDVRAVTAPQVGSISLPISAIMELDGKPVVFVKSDSQTWRVAYVQLGNGNGKRTIITKGIQPGERVMITGAYQAKMIYENQ